MYAVTSALVVSLTLATLRSAEFGFLGVVVKTRTQTPRRLGRPLERRRLGLLGHRLATLPDQLLDGGQVEIDLENIGHSGVMAKRG
jgi:hypothetical protein